MKYYFINSSNNIGTFCFLCYSLLFIYNLTYCNSDYYFKINIILLIFILTNLKLITIILLLSI
jgi:hypothetical protein